MTAKWFFFFKQKTAYEMRISDWSSDVCSSDLFERTLVQADPDLYAAITGELDRQQHQIELIASENIVSRAVLEAQGSVLTNKYAEGYPGKRYYNGCEFVDVRSEEHTSELQSLMRISYAVFCLKKNKSNTIIKNR